MTVPSELFRNAIDLNRYSTGVARRLIVAYNQIILDAVQQLQGSCARRYRLALDQR